MAAAAASSAYDSDFPPLWPPVGITAADIASIAAATCDNGRQGEAERDCSTRASSECGEDVAAVRVRWADLSDHEDAASSAVRKGYIGSSAAAAAGGEASAAAAAAASEYQEAVKGRSASDQQPRSRRSGGRSAKADRSYGASSNGWPSSSSASWDQWEDPGVYAWSAHGGDSRGSNGKARSWQRQRAATDPTAAGADGSWHGKGSGASSSSGRWWHDDDWSQSHGWSAYRSNTSASSSRGNGRRGKWQCQFFVGIEEEENFQVVRRLLGAHGKHVKAIAEKTGAKLRLRGRGSGFKEGPEKEESADELMLCVSAPDQYGYTTAVSMIWAHMEEVYKQYAEFFSITSSLEVRMHEGPRDGSF
eukprot:TRINITY_DN10911_c0_g1_i2.p1 TRINITY_DN10911_c0_g1~~TRINITY_DN10911_c0_g1_i2.p1  ORF type:complete len:362 (+),score=64.64 TRINITY_DN10911_c0_g1_i2:104-1189(+)